MRLRWLFAAALISVAGCGTPLPEVHDPQLKPIQEMVEKSLPLGSTVAAVNQFLNVRGYPTDPTRKPGTVVAMIRHMDQEKLQPVTARVTFYFDANGKLNTYKIVRTMNPPLPQ